MATQCRSSKCTAERKGFRRELDSWRHKLIHCVGFESILEGIYGPMLLRDLSIFDDCEPEVAHDWSVYASCSFCNLQLQKLSDNNLVDASPQSPPPAETPPPQGLSNSEKLQCQANRFLHAIFCKKDFPQSCDPNIPLVAQELMRKMIRQFAIEYVSKSQTHEGKSDLGVDVDSAGSLPNRSDQDSPLDLTVSRNHLGLDRVDGALDLSRKASVGSVTSTSANASTCQIASGRPQKEDYLERSSEFSEGLLSKALKDIQSGSLDVHKAAILYGIPQKTLLLQLEALSYKDKASVLRSFGQENGSDRALRGREARLVLQRVAAWARAQTEHSELGKLSSSAENSELRLPAASSYLHQLTLQKMASQLREKNESLFPEATTPPSSPSMHIKVPQVRLSSQAKVQVDLAGLVDAMYQASKVSTAADCSSSSALHKLKTILPKQGQLEYPAPLLHSGIESCLLQADLSPLCLNLRSGNAGSVGSAEDGDDVNRDKQPRKKRGRYRQYDHDILEEAIAMVMHGKMSVSKAQGIYGIPHSTLEYKVKERTGTLKTPPKKKPRLAEPGLTGPTNSGTTISKRL